MHQKMWTWKKPWSVAVLALAVALGCGDETQGPGPEDEHPHPGFLSVEVTRSFAIVRVQQTVTLRATALNTDGRSVRFTWTASSGRFLDDLHTTETSSEVTWYAPDCAGRADGEALISLKAFDEKRGSTTRVVPVQVLGCKARLIASGGAHSLAQLEDGSVWAWGQNAFLQRGDGTTAPGARPVKVSGVTRVTALAAGEAHSLAVRENGTVWAWGSDEYGQLGNGSSGAGSAPAQVPGLSGVIALTAGVHHSLAVRDDGTVWAWGRNHYGQLGDGTDAQRDAPVQVPGLTGITAVAAGAEFSLALRNDGTVWAWGYDAFGQLGDGNGTGFSSYSPVQVSGLTGITAIAAGHSHGLALRGDGTVWAWGLDSRGQVGDGAPASSGVEAPVQVLGLSRVTAVSAGTGHSLALRDDGTVWAWGWNEAGQVGDVVTTTPRFAPVQVRELTGVTAISAGHSHSLALLGDGSMPGWGSNSAGQLGNGTTTDRFTPVPVAQLANVTQVTAGEDHTAALRDDGTVWVWGSNSASQVGDAASGGMLLRPGQVPGLTRVVSISAGWNHTLAVRDDGTVWAWGLSLSSPRSASPVQVSGLADITAVATNRFHSLALRNDGTVWAWGDNSIGELGDGTTDARASRVQVPGLTGVTAISVGLAFSVALRNDGTVWTWGINENGQLGQGALSLHQATPTQVPGLTGVTAISAGLGHALALRNDGTVWAWGFNRYGQLGDGSTTQRASPVQVQGLTGITAISASAGQHSLAVGGDGSIWAWGDNASGQLGAGSGPFRMSPVRAIGATGIAAIATGRSHSLARRSDGTVLAWGTNAMGQVGDGTFAPNPAPAPVLLP
jgi:alpha-tubulin suppressor-like RCC1 family protein